jgi:hypothetical protein
MNMIHERTTPLSFRHIILLLVAALMAGAVVCAGSSARADLVSNLYGYWPLDGGLLDHSGGGHPLTPGTVSIPALSLNGQFGQCYKFDNITSGSQMFTAGAITVANTSAVTISAWVNADQFVSGFTNYSPHMVAYLFNTSDAAASLQLRVRDKKAEIYYAYPAANNVGSVTLTTGTWTLLTATQSGTSLKLYVNGAPAGSFTVTGQKAYNRLYIGATNPTGTSWRGWPGRIDDVRLYTRALTDTEVADLYALTPTLPPVDATPDVERGVLGAWHLAGNVNDSTGNGMTLTAPGVGGAPTPFATEDVNASCYLFDNATTAPQFLALEAGTFENAPTSGVTVTAWINPSVLGTGFTASAPPTIAHLLHSSGGKDLLFRIRDTMLDVYYTNPSANNYTSFVVPLNTWSFVAVTQGGNKLRVYLNNQVTEFGVLGGAGFNTFYLGTLNNGTTIPRAFNGMMDEVSVYNRMLSTAEIDAVRTGVAVVPVELATFSAE